MDLEAAENAYRDPRDQISYSKTIWKCPCNGCKKAQKLERERIASLIQAQHLLASEGEPRRYGLRMVECKYGNCDCYAIIDMIMEEPK